MAHPLVGSHQSHYFKTPAEGNKPQHLSSNWSDLAMAYNDLAAK